MPIAELQSPSELPLMSPSDSTHGGGFPADVNNGSAVGGGEASADTSTKVQMKKQLGLLEGVAIILGIIFGSGESHVWPMWCV